MPLLLSVMSLLATAWLRQVAAVRGLHEGGARVFSGNRNEPTCLVGEDPGPLGHGAQHADHDCLGDAARPASDAADPVNNLYGQLTGSATKDEDPENI